MQGYSSAFLVGNSKENFQTNTSLLYSFGNSCSVTKINYSNYNIIKYIRLIFFSLFLLLYSSFLSYSESSCLTKNNRNNSDIWENNIFYNLKDKNTNCLVLKNLKVDGANRLESDLQNRLVGAPCSIDTETDTETEAYQEGMINVKMNNMLNDTHVILNCKTNYSLVNSSRNKVYCNEGTLDFHFDGCIFSGNRGEDLLKYIDNKLFANGNKSFSIDDLIINRENLSNSIYSAGDVVAIQCKEKIGYNLVSSQVMLKAIGKEEWQEIGQGCVYEDVVCSSIPDNVAIYGGSLAWKIKGTDITYIGDALVYNSRIVSSLTCSTNYTLDPTKTVDHEYVCSNTGTWTSVSANNRKCLAPCSGLPSVSLANGSMAWKLKNTSTNYTGGIVAYNTSIVSYNAACNSGYLMNTSNTTEHEYICNNSGAWSSTIAGNRNCVYQSGSRTFNYTGGTQYFYFSTYNLSTLKIKVYGAQGGSGGGSGGYGGMARGTLNKDTRGDILYLNVGQSGSRAGYSRTFGGGGSISGCCGSGCGYGASGGGGSDVRYGGSATSNRIIVAGGGGGGGENGNHGGGAGGGSTGYNGSGNAPGYGGTQYAGGSCGSGYCESGQSFYGGVAKNSGSKGYWCGGAGGGGYYGGSSGEYGKDYYGAGGGGSGYIGGVSAGAMSSGAKSGNGSVIICWGSNTDCN